MKLAKKKRPHPRIESARDRTGTYTQPSQIYIYIIIEWEGHAYKRGKKKETHIPDHPKNAI